MSHWTSHALGWAWISFSNTDNEIFFCRATKCRRRHPVASFSLAMAGRAVIIATTPSGSSRNIFCSSVGSSFKSLSINVLLASLMDDVLALSLLLFLRGDW